MDKVPPVPAPTPHVAPEGASLVQIVLILRRRWRILAGIWSLTVLIAAVYTFTSTRLYRPQASLEIRPESPVLGSNDLNDSYMASLYNYDNYSVTQEQILTSPALLETVFKALPEAIRREYDGQPEPWKALGGRLEIEKVRRSFILKVGFVDKSPEYATQIVNTLVSVYMEDANRHLRELKSGAAEIMSKETLPALRSKVEESDRALQAFQADTGYVDFEEHYKALIEARRRLETRITDLILRRAKARAELEALSSYGADGLTGAFNPAFHSTKNLEQLVEQRSKVATELDRDRVVLKEKHPRIVAMEEELRSVERRIRESIVGTLQTLQNDLRAVSLEEGVLAEEQAKVDQKIVDAGKRLNQYRRLESELVSSKELYNSYLKKHGETSATTGAGLASVRVLDHASVPTSPYKPNLVTNLGVAIMLGLLLGVSGIILTEQLDDRIGSPREVEAFLGLEVLGVIPRLSQADKARHHAVLLGDDLTLPEFEAFRGLRAEVVTRLSRVPDAKVVAILSALPDEGKSTVAVNLARTLAMEGRKILLLDADLRNPSIRSVMGPSDAPGLEEVLAGRIPVEQGVYRSPMAGVDILGASKGVSGAAELAGSPTFESVLRWAKERYDLVLIDSAPVNLVSESALVARWANRVLFVVREGRTSRGSALAALKRLDGMEVSLLGAVVNCPEARGGSYGYYSYAYPK